MFIDNATDKLQPLRFCESKSNFDYMLSTRAYLEQYGNPLAFYSVKHSVFGVDQKFSQDSRITQFGRILNELTKIILTLDTYEILSFQF